MNYLNAWETSTIPYSIDIMRYCEIYGNARCLSIDLSMECKCVNLVYYLKGETRTLPAPWWLWARYLENVEYWGRQYVLWLFIYYKNSLLKGADLRRICFIIKTILLNKVIVKVFFLLTEFPFYSGIRLNRFLPKITAIVTANCPRINKTIYAKLASTPLCLANR